MKIVYKYPLWQGGLTMLELPKQSKFLKFDRQGEEFYVWFEVSPFRVEREVRSLIVYGTGQEISNDSTWYETILDGEFVWHLYEVSTGGKS